MQPMTMRAHATDDDACGIQPSAAISGHQRQSAAISGHQRPSTAIGEDLT
jgi:hypothetical protein